MKTGDEATIQVRIKQVSLSEVQVMTASGHWMWVPKSDLKVPDGSR